MPQDIAFDLPFPVRTSPDAEGARRRNLRWVQQHRLVTGDQALAWYRSWDMPRLAACGFPYAQGPELDLCTDAMAFFFLFDDQFDGPLSRAPRDVARLCQSMIDIVHGTGPRRQADPCSAAFADLWRRSTDGAPPGWAARTAHEWEYYFAAHAHEAVNRCRAVPSDMERYLQVRRGVAGTALPVSLGERAAAITVPAVAFHSPHLRIMREITVDVTLMCNDVYSLEKEEARGDMDNLVLVIQHARGCSRQEAVAAARDEVHRHVTRFRQLAAEVPDMCRQVGLTGPQCAAVEAYVEVMTAWMSGYHLWETETARYRAAVDVLPDSGPGHFEKLLGSEPEQDSRP
ncbi:terpene cyclase [Planomonospora sphaerica]|uniref:Terpene synthase n=1 Tax=Planomonospora sphaerica TaxID=161355 RepID=A0A171CWA0_9ACTN|nr:terpene cyclase [Planomonospora sphaerica]GAT67318.1 terpene cyclase [Planomonospora sphaerica]